MDRDIASAHQGRVAFVTGAGSGIGRGVATRLAADGAKVACLDYHGDAADATARDLNSGGSEPRAIAICADVRDRDRVRAGIEKTVEALGDIDYLVNAAGRLTMTGFPDLTDEEWDEIVDVNLKGYFIVAQEFSRRVRPDSGAAIVNISTIESEVIVSSTGHCQVHYNASKGGVRTLTKALAAELAPRGVRVNAVAPGPVDTPFTGYDMKSPEVFKFLSERLLIKRVAEPADVANAVSFLLSADASYITGVQLPVDGGWLVR